LTVGELIDFYLSIRQKGDLLGFDSLYEADLEGLREKIQRFYGDRDAWLAMPEDTELPEEIGTPALDLVDKFSIWNGGKSIDEESEGF
jgi:hypothetical protein